MDEYLSHKLRRDFEDDQRYEMEGMLRHELNYAMKHHGMSEDEAFYLLNNPEEGFKWLQNNG